LWIAPDKEFWSSEPSRTGALERSEAMSHGLNTDQTRTKAVPFNHERMNKFENTKKPIDPSSTLFSVLSEFRAFVFDLRVPNPCLIRVQSVADLFMLAHFSERSQKKESRTGAARLAALTQGDVCCYYFPSACTCVNGALAVARGRSRCKVATAPADLNL
jgi:hypothetical protein